MLKGNASRPDQKLKNTTISDFFTSKSNSVKRKRSTNQTGNELPISKKKIDEGSINNIEQTLQLTSSMMSEESLGSVIVLRECPVVPEEMAHSTTDSNSNNYSTDKNASLKVSTFDSSRLLSAQKEAEVLAMSTEITDDGIDSLIENVQQSSSGSPEFNVKSKPATSSQVKEISRPRPCSPLLFDSSQVSTPDPESMEFQDEVLLPAIKEMGGLNKIPYCWETNPFNAKSETRHLKLYNTEHKGPGPPPSKSTTYYDIWDSHHVRLPCSPENRYPVEENKEKKLVKRWDLIQSSLRLGIANGYQLQKAILAYNSRYCKKWSFHMLENFFSQSSETYKQKFFNVILPRMVDLALSLPAICIEPIPLMSSQRNCKVTITQQQIACLLSNAFFCTYPRRNSLGPNSEYANYPDINFSSLFNGYGSWQNSPFYEKIKTLLHYFEKVCENMPTGTVTFERRSLSDFPLWEQSPCHLRGLHLSNDGRIEDEGTGMLQVDFANKFIGGGVLSSGLVQEEILFCICPELIVSKLFVEKLDDNECVIITGAEQYSSYTGYADSYKWAGNFNDTTIRDEHGRRCRQIVAMDATCFRRQAIQYKPQNVRRELNKAFCGFFCDYDPEHSPAVATGNWGCGAFGGDPIFKGLIQLMAAAVAGRDLCYFTFNDEDLMEELREMHLFIKQHKMPVCDLWKLIVSYHKQVVEKEKNFVACNIFQFIREMRSSVAKD